MIHIALTCDVERDQSIQTNMPKVQTIFKEYGVVGTWFIQHDLGNQYTNDCGVVDDCYPKIVESLDEIGEIGTHVHFRNKKGIFQTDFQFQKTLIEAATDSLRDKGYKAKSFRGGDHFLTNETLHILEELHYLVDSSIMQGFTRHLQDNLRLDYRIHDNIDYFNKPYHPDTNNVLQKGNSQILEIPVTNILFFQKRPKYFLPFPTPGHMNLGGLSQFIYTLTKTWDFIRTDTFLIILFHDFTFNAKRSMYYLEKFIKKCSNDPKINLITLSDIYRKTDA